MFYVRPLSEDTLQRGIVQHAFDHKGGGDEVFFEKGTTDGTFMHRIAY